MKFTITFINSINKWIGHATAWLVLAMVLIIVYDVLMRRFFSIGSVQLQELQWHLFALIFLLGAAYTFQYDEHVRVDIFYQRFSAYSQAWLNIIGNLVFLLPFCILIIYTSYPFVMASFNQFETSPDPGGLPYRFVLKAAIPFAFALLLLQAIANTLMNILVILGYCNLPEYRGCCPVNINKGEN